MKGDPDGRTVLPVYRGLRVEEIGTDRKELVEFMKSENTGYSGVHDNEVSETLRRIQEETPEWNGINYFLEIVAAYHMGMQADGERPEVVVLGTGLPEEMIYGAGGQPYWITGGCLEAANAADDWVPRDTDPVSRSILGSLFQHMERRQKNALILVPLINDSSRKLTFLLGRMGKKVHAVDIPPVKANGRSMEYWDLQMEKLGEALGKYTGKIITHRSFRKAGLQVGRARTLAGEFLRLAGEYPSGCPGTVKMFVLYSYYCTGDIQKWCGQLEALNREISMKAGKTQRNQKVRTLMPHSEPSKGNVLLIGSPVYFPNYKIPYLIQETGLSICAQMDATVKKLYEPLGYKMPDMDSAGNIWRTAYYRDASSAYPSNRVMFRTIESMLKRREVDGVVYHVLKGQIEYDFELERFEKLFDRHGIPVFRLETDYKYNDVEQLRIRLEAFMEMLVQNQYRKEKIGI